MKNQPAIKRADAFFAVFFALVLALVAFLPACAPTKPGPELDLLRVTEVYNQYIARMEFENAAVFVASPYRAEYEARSRKVVGLKILNHRLVQASSNEAKGEAQLIVEFDYYYTSSPRTKQYVDVQKWFLLLEDGRSVWRLGSPFPAFP